MLATSDNGASVRAFPLCVCERFASERALEIVHSRYSIVCAWRARRWSVSCLRKSDDLVHELRVFFSSSYVRTYNVTLREKLLAESAR